MAANPSKLGALLYDSESSFGESSTTYSERIPITNNVNDILSALKHDKIDTHVTKQYVNDSAQDALGVQTAEFPVTGWLQGHGATTASGALTASDTETFLGRCIGVLDTSEVGTTVAEDAGNSATQIALTAGTFADGGICRIGARGDSAGGGEFYQFDAAATATLMNACASEPSAGAVVYASAMCYPYETPNATMPSMRMNALSSNQRAGIWGVFCSGLEFHFTVGELPYYTATMTASRWAMESASTWPTATSTDSSIPAPCTGGRVFVQVNGTTTRAVRTIRNLDVTVNMERIPLLGYDSDNAYQSIIGYREIANNLTVSWDEDSEAAGTDTLGGYYDGSSFYQLMFTFSAADGSAMGLRIGKAKVVTPRPTQMDVDGLNQKRITMQSVTDGSTSGTASALTRANYILAFA